MTRPVLLVDNLDSFSFNLVAAFEDMGCLVQVIRNSASADDVMTRATDSGAVIVLSPGPGRPEDAGCLIELVARAKGVLPVLGVCLGHQAIVLQAGGIVTAVDPCHGRASAIDHDAAGPFAGFESAPIRVGRYHSLATPVDALPDRFTVHAALAGAAMAISDRAARQIGLQFHPESILTAQGPAILANSLAMLSG